MEDLIIKRTHASISQIPLEIKVDIFNLLPEKDFLIARQVCSEWNKACQICGNKKNLILENKKIDEKEANMLLNLPFSNLTFDSCILYPKSILIIAKSDKYKKLYFNNSKIGDSGLRILSKNLKALISFSVSNDNISYLGIIGLVSGNVSSLISLSLNNDIIGNASVRRMFSEKKFTSLKSLSLSGNYIEDEVALVLTTENFPSLTSLDLSKNRISNEVKQKLMDKFIILNKNIRLTL
jgi:hypothetical protein